MVLDFIIFPLRQPAFLFSSFGAYQRSLSLNCQEGEITVCQIKSSKPHMTCTLSTQRSPHVDTVQANLESFNGLQTDTPQTQSTTSATLTGFIR